MNFFAPADGLYIIYIMISSLLSRTRIGLNQFKTPPIKYDYTDKSFIAIMTVLFGGMMYSGVKRYYLMNIEQRNDDIILFAKEQVDNTLREQTKILIQDMKLILQNNEEK